MSYKRMAVYHLRILSVILLLVPGRAQISALSESHEAEAKPCETSAGTAGVCRLLTECPSVVRAIAYGNRQHTRCGFVDAVEVVCCPLESATHIVSSSSTRIESPTASPYYSETSLKSDENLLALDKEHEARPTVLSVNATDENIIASDETNVLENSDENETRNLSSENDTSEDGLSERLFLSRKKKLLAPILPSTLLKNIVSSILTKPTRATQKATLELKPTSNPVKENEPDKINEDEIPSTNPRPNTPNSSNYEPFTRPVLTIQPGIPQPTPGIIPVPWLPPTKPTDLEAESSEIIVPILKPIYDPYNATLTITHHSDPISVSTQLHYSTSSPSVIYNEKPTFPFFYNFPSTTSVPEEPSTNHESYWEDFPDETVTEVPNSLPTGSSIGHPWPTAVQRPTTEREEATKPKPDSSEILYPPSRPDIVSQNQPLEPSLTSSVQNQSAAQKPSDIWKKITSLAAGLKSRRACDAYRKIPVLTRYIIGGDYAAQGEFPHMVALGFRKPKDTNLSWLCGGSLISNQYVLTAAHCIKTRYGAPQVVRVGFTDLSAPGAVGSEAPGEEEEVAVAAALAHPAYDAAARAHDIALLRLARPLRFSQAVLPACLRNAAPAPPGPLLVTGWGSVTPDGSTPSDLMKKALVTPTDDATCRSFYRNFYRPEMICAGSNDEVDTCKGDSGGPMQLLEDPTSPIYTVVGITSFGPTPCAGPRPGVYTRVASYLSWLEAVVWPDDAT